MEKDVISDDIEWITDKIGEKADIATCPPCNYPQDCFANMGGRCTALIVACTPCPFYKSADVNQSEIQRSINRLKLIGRYDLIRKYALTLAMLGALDGEIENMRCAGSWLGEYQKSSLAELMRRAMAGDLSALDMDDDEPDDFYEPDDDGRDDGEEGDDWEGG